MIASDGWAGSPTREGGVSPDAALLVGLGNPGDRYHRTRHNLGWQALERIVDACALHAAGYRFEGRFGDGRVTTGRGGHRVWWLMPETYMNLSGRSVGAAARFFKLQPEQIVVLHDDLDLEVGRIKIKRGGGNGGHNGLNSIQQVLGSANFTRVRLGIGRPPDGFPPARFVLAPFSALEQARVALTLERLPQAVPGILEGAFSVAMNHLHNALSAR